ncbi:hypothetical protein D7Y44_15015 [Stenotrophomonas maltophilia]|uniref:hypothetical protein n=1 Tax=Stenotrophomonas maltophilia TaxID=40324 RepID=UPI0015DF3038|nr:hypothetical protein [Stenotrophomonas maltophilia]MBA0358740.1 hypothetical protein [Stenotrophomonas maltophilia]
MPIEGTYGHGSHRNAALRMKVVPLLLGVVACSASGATPSPEHEYTLQARVLLQDDASARAVLAELGPGWVPHGRIEWQDIVDDVPAWLGNQTFPAPSPAIVGAFSDALGARLATVYCEARNFLPLGSPEIGMFALECRHPDMTPLREAYLALREAEQSDRQAQSDALFKRWTTILRDAPDRAHCTAVTGWYKGDHEATDAARAQQLYRAVLAGLLPLDAWDARGMGEDTSALCRVR